MALKEAQVSTERVQVAKIEFGLLSFNDNEISRQNVQDSIRSHPVANYQCFTETANGRK